MAKPEGSISMLRLLEPSQRLGLYGLVGARVLLGLCDLVVAGAMYLLFTQLQGEATYAVWWWMPHTVLTTSIETIMLVVFRMLLDILCVHAVVVYTQGLYTGFLLRLAGGYGEMRWSQLVQRNRSELLKHMTVTSLDAAYSFQLYIERVSGTITVGLFAAALIYKDAKMALGLGLIGAGLYALHHFFLRDRLNQAGVQRESSLRALQRLLSELLASAKEVRTYANHTFFERRIRQHAERFNKSNAKLGELPHISRVVADQGVVALFLGVVIEVQVRHGDMRQLLAIMVYYFVLSRRLVPLISQLAMVFGQMEGANESVATIRREMDECAAHQAHAGLAEPPRSGLILELEGVGFTFDSATQGDANEVLRGVDLIMRSGEIVVLQGVSGSGKSSLLNLIAGVAHPGRGRVMVDRKNVAYVPQEIVLLDDSVRHNLLFGLDDPGEVELLSALAMVRMDDFILGLPQGLDTRVGDNGVLFSGGQRQRLGLARALLRHVGLLLLDEATSALDEENERYILRNLADSGVALLLVTHRGGNREIADRLFYLEQGLLVEVSKDGTGLDSAAASLA